MQHTNSCKADTAEVGMLSTDGRVRSGIRTAHTQEAMRECITKFLKAMPTQSCANCQCNNPSIRRYTYCYLLHASQDCVSLCVGFLGSSRCRHPHLF